jgi:hypothetical protein
MRTLYRYNKESGRVEEVFREDPSERLHIISDNLGGVYWNPAYKKTDPGAWTDSKSRFRELTRRAGKVEVGNERQEWRDSSKSYNVKDAVLKAKRFLTYKNDW